MKATRPFGDSSERIERGPWAGLEPLGELEGLGRRRREVRASPHPDWRAARVASNPKRKRDVGS